MSIKESLQKIRKNLESAQAEIANLYDLVESLEETVGGPTARETTPAPKKQSKPKASRGTATERVLARIEGSPAGISSDAIIKETGLEWITALRAPQTLKLNPSPSLPPI
jgi:hypothetical protein